MYSYPNDVIFVKYYVKRGFPGDSVVKNSPANAERLHEINFKR